MSTEPNPDLEELTKRLSAYLTEEKVSMEKFTEQNPSE